MRKIRSLNVQNRKGESEPKDHKEKVPILKGENEITSVKDYTTSSFNDGWKYIYGINPTNKTFVKDNLVFMKANEENAYEMDSGFGVSGMYFYPYFASINAMVTLDYYRKYLGDKTLVLMSVIFKTITWPDERYKYRITLLKDDFEQVVKIINNMTKTKTTIDLNTVSDFYNINKAIVEGNYKPYVTRVSIVELFNLYKTIRAQLPEGCYQIQTSAYPFRRNGVDLEIYSKWNSNHNNAYLSYYVPGNGEQPYQIWNCNIYKELPQTFNNKDKTIEFEENGQTKEYYKVIMVKENETYYPILYLDWGEYDVDKVMSLDPKSIEPAILTPLSYYGYLKTIADNVSGVCHWAFNSIFGRNIYNTPFSGFITDHKKSFTSDEVYKYCKLDEYLCNLTLTVCEFLLENIEKIKTFYSKTEEETDSKYIERITWKLITLGTNSNYNPAEEYPDRNFKDYYPPYMVYFYLIVPGNAPEGPKHLIMKDYGTITDGVFTFDNTRSMYPSSFWISYHGNDRDEHYVQLPKPDNLQEYSKDMRDYSQAMKWIYSKTSDPKNLMMSIEQNPPPVTEADPGDYTEYQIIN